MERYTGNLDRTSETGEGCYDEDGIAGMNNLDLDCGSIKMKPGLKNCEEFEIYKSACKFHRGLKI